MKFRQNTLWGVTLLLCGGWVCPGWGHGRLWEPPSRSTMWRRGYLTPPNYDDNALYCGGFNHQMKLGYKCGVCGDPYDKPRENEAGGKYATGIVTRTYRQGQRTTFQVDLTANHKGFFEFKLCPTNDPFKKATQECLDLHPVSLADGSGTRFHVGPDSGMVNISVVLPEGLTCSRCVLQWRYHAANSWGTDPDGTSCVGCGYQEEFYACADIEISASGNSKPDLRKEKPKYLPTSPRRSSSSTLTTSAPKIAQQQTRVGSARTNLVKDLTTSRATPATSSRFCQGVGGRGPLDGWCQINCAADFCPSSHCVCTEQTPPTLPPGSGCQATRSFSSLPGYHQWCVDNCAAGYCPSSICVCS